MEELEFEGFHATSRLNAEKIFKEGFKINRDRNDEWLGYGIYMFYYEIDAKSWAKKTHYCKKDPVIIKCFLNMKKDKYLDLDNPESKNIYEKYYENLLNQFSVNNKKLVFKNKYEAMCWGLNIYKYDKKIELIKYTFTNSRTKNIMKYKTSKYGYDYNEIQMCVTCDRTIANKRCL